MPRKKSARSGNIFYGWYILAACFIILFFSTGFRVSIGVLFKPLMMEFGWDRGLMSMAFFLNMIVFSLSLLLAGKIYDAHGPKHVIIVSASLLAVGYIGVSVSHSVYMFFFSYGILAAAGMGGTTVPLLAALMTKWFYKHRGFAISLGLTGVSMGQFILVPLFARAILLFGWRDSYLYLSLIMFFVVTALALLVIKGDPDELGITPLGAEESEPAPRSPDETEAPEREGRDLRLGEAMRTPSFWLFLITMFICGSGDFLVLAHLVPMVTDHGVSSLTAGSMLGWVGLLSLAGMLTAGPMSDRVGNKLPIVITFIARVGLFALIIAYRNPLSFWVFSLGYGVTLMVTAPLNATLISRLYGISHVGLISGFITTIHHMGGGFWAYMGGELFDRTGSYRMIFAISATMALVAVLCTLFIKEKKHTV